MTSTTGAGGFDQAEPASYLKPFVTGPAEESQEHWLLRVVDWEGVKRAAARCKKADTFNASWASFVAGLAFTAVIALVSAFLSATDSAPQTGAKAFFGAVSLLGVMATVAIWQMEKRNRANRVDFLDALNEEIEAAQRAMKKVPASE